MLCDLKKTTLLSDINVCTHLRCYNTLNDIKNYYDVEIIIIQTTITNNSNGYNLQSKTNKTVTRIASWKIEMIKSGIKSISNDNKNIQTNAVHLSFR